MSKIPNSRRNAVVSVLSRAAAIEGVPASIPAGRSRGTGKSDLMQKESKRSGFLSPWLRLMAILSLSLVLVMPSVAHARDQKSDDSTTEEVECTPQTYDPETYDPEDHGLINDTEYESPQFGHTLEWSGGWSVNSWYDDPANTGEGPSVWSNNWTERDSISLYHDGANGETAWLEISIQSGNRGGPEGDLAMWLDKSFWSGYDGTAIAADTTRDMAAAVFVSEDADSGDVYYLVYESVTLDDGVTMYLIWTFGEGWTDYESASEDLALDGDSLDPVFTSAELEAAIEANEEIEMTHGIAESAEKAGLVSDTEYESPQFGHTLEWTDDWAIDYWYSDPANTAIGPAVLSDEDEEVDGIHLMWDSPQDTSAFLAVSIHSEKPGGPDADIETWIEEYIENEWTEQVDVLLEETSPSSSAILVSSVHTYTCRQPLTLFQSILLDDGTTQVIVLGASANTFTGAYEATSEDMTFNGDSIDLVFSPADLEEAIDAHQDSGR